MSIASQTTARPESGDLSVTALYTSATWAWAGLTYAELFVSRDSRLVFWVTNAVLALAGIFVRGATSLRHSLVQRHVLIDRIIASTKTPIVIELAAGLSRRGAAMSADASIHYFEFDVPLVTARKRSLLQSTPEGRVVALRPNYEIHEADVLCDRWEEVAPTDGSRVVVAEGLLMYLNPSQRRDLFARVAACIQRNGGAFVFDLVPPNEQPKPGVIGQALGWLMRRFTGGIGFEDTDITRESILEDLTAAGFDTAEALEPHLIADQWGLPFVGQRTTQLVFHAKRHVGSHENLGA